MKHLLIYVLLIICTGLVGGEAYVINSNSLTLSRLDYQAGTSNNSFSELGATANCSPNKMALSDEYIYVVITYENRVQKINIETGATMGYIFLEDSSSPNDICIKGNYAYVTGNDSDMLYRIDLLTEDVTSINVGRAPQGLVANDTYLFVANCGYLPLTWSYGPGTCSVIRRSDFSLVETLNTALNPTQVAINDNKLYVSCTGDYGTTYGSVDVFDLNDFSHLRNVATGGTAGAICFVNDTAIVANTYPAGSSGFDLQTYNIMFDNTNSPLPPANSYVFNGEVIAALDAGNYIEPGTVKILNTNYTPLHSINVGVGPTDIKLSPYMVVTDDALIMAVAPLIDAYPNPFHQQISFASRAPTNGHIKIDIFDIKGRKINTCLDSWNGLNKQGQTVARGVYFAKLKIHGQTVCKKILKEK